MEIKNFYEVNGIDGNDMISEAFVYDLKSSLMASGLPMRTKLEEESENKLLNRGKKLGNLPSVSGEDNYLSGIRVSLNLKHSNKMDVELQRYNFLDIVSSSSTSHRIMNFNISDFDNHVDKNILFAWDELRKEYLKTPTKEKYLEVLYSCPAGLRLTARISLNYRQLKQIYLQRNNHKLEEWRLFCQWILTLPYFRELTGIGIIGGE